MARPQIYNTEWCALDPCLIICYNTDVNNILKESLISKHTRLNQDIRAPQLRVIGSDGRQLGILSRNEALQIAEQEGLDLVEISPDAKPPVAKIVDWGKFNYQRTKQLQKNKRNAKALEVKQMRFGLKISDHDLGVKMKKVTSFLEAGNKVKITIFYRGRELAHKDVGFKLADKVIASFGEDIVVEQTPQFAGKQLNFVIRSNNAKVKKS
ncbi:MAG TPA: translation initiation factor IF-3 [Candidatus Saccharimonadales bacterium]|nr:translation initiation factor IF-3 [Candidatus Saccharimonadales bacterium]